MKKPVLILATFLLLFSSSSHTAMANSECLKINKWYPTQVLSGGESGTGKLKFVSAVAIRSKDFNRVYFVAIKFKATGVGNQVGVWAVSGKLPQKPADLSGLTLAVDSIAQQFTVWPDGDKTQAQIMTNDRYVSKAKSCLKR